MAVGLWGGLNGYCRPWKFIFKIFCYVELLWRWLCKVRFGGGGMIIIFIWYVEKVSGEKRLLSLLSINIIPKIQDKIEFWVVSSFEQEKRQQPDLITAFGLISFMKLLGLFPHKYSKMYRFCRPQLKLWERILHLGYYQQRFHPNGLMGDWR